MPTVLITGANRGLGLELARQYSRDGWRVLACSRSAPSELDKLDGVETYKLDVTDHTAIDALADRLEGTPIDVLMNNAGVNGQASIDSRNPQDQAFGNTDYENWDRTFRINLIGPMKMAESFLNHVIASKQKKIITLSSQLSSVEQNRSGGLYSYRASKAGVNAIMKSMAVDLSKHGVLAIALHPGWVRTDLGGENADIDVATSVTGMRRVIAELTPQSVDKLIAYNGEVVPY